MRACSACGNTILIGGSRHADLRFCDDRCLEQGALLIEASAVPEAVVLEVAHEVHRGLCPRCGGSGPVDVHIAHRIWSLILFSSYSSTPAISCRPCGVRRQLGGFVFSAIAGWWGFPWGLLMTPVQLVRNLVAMISPTDPMFPSPGLLAEMRIVIAEQALLEDQEKVE